MSTATMFYAQPTVIDHAYINEKGQVVGGSFQPDFLISGKLDPQESVVVDFGTGKKQLKGWIDHKECGFDHKLWLINGFSDFKLRSYEGVAGAEMYQIETPALTLWVPQDAVKLVDAAEGEVYGSRNACRWIGEVVSEKMGLTVVARNGGKKHTVADSRAGQYAMNFTYVHGLKDSTSWGCVNLAHGHDSFIQATPDAGQGRMDDVDSLICNISEELDGTIFIKRENVLYEDSCELTVSFVHNERGAFKATYRKDWCKLVVLETETTVELLMEYVLDRWGKQLKDAGAIELFLSEGLSKGAYAQL